MSKKKKRKNRYCNYTIQRRFDFLIAHVKTMNNPKALAAARSLKKAWSALIRHYAKSSTNWRRVVKRVPGRRNINEADVWYDELPIKTQAVTDAERKLIETLGMPVTARDRARYNRGAQLINKGRLLRAKMEVQYLKARRHLKKAKKLEDAMKRFVKRTGEVRLVVPIFSYGVAKGREAALKRTKKGNALWRRSGASIIRGEKTIWSVQSTITEPIVTKYCISLQLLVKKPRRPITYRVQDAAWGYMTPQQQAVYGRNHMPRRKAKLRR